VKAVILAGSEGVYPYPLVEFCPRPLLPFLGKPFLEWQLRHLREAGFTEVGLAVRPEDVAPVSAYFGDGQSLGVRLVIASDPLPRGPAGCLRLFEDFIGSDAFLVTCGTTYLGSVDLGELVRAHREQRAAATLGMCRNPAVVTTAGFENVVMAADGRIRRFAILHPSEDRRRTHTFAGIYMFDARVLRSIPAEGFADIREQLIPQLCEQREIVTGVPLARPCAWVKDTEQYEHVQKALLRRGGAAGNGHVRLADDVWADPDVRIRDSAYLLGPVVIGRGCVIEEGAHIIGPAVIGEGCRVGRGAVIRESILWDRAEVMQQARVEYSILGFDCPVEAGRRVSGEIVMHGRDASRRRYRHGPDKSAGRVEPVLSPANKLKAGVNAAAKRVMDVLGSAVLLALCGPLLLLIAVAIKLDSRGPVFFAQRRCGKDGRLFWMYKFRTMVPEAEKMQDGLRTLKSVDGPVFKIFDDPRVTYVGRFLRRNSLDELPQFYNVLKGDMSLVGPRPLAMKEMKMCPSWRDLRLTVKPGITGLWQINGRSATGFHDWVRHDITYVKQQSITMDCKILAKTAVWVLARIGAY